MRVLRQLLAFPPGSVRLSVKGIGKDWVSFLIFYTQLDVAAFFLQLTCFFWFISDPKQ